VTAVTRRVDCYINSVAVNVLFILKRSNPLKILVVFL
jgi:hypothetical protein